MELYGFHPPSIISLLKGKYKVPAIEDQIKHQQEVLQSLMENLAI